MGSLFANLLGGFFRSPIDLSHDPTDTPTEFIEAYVPTEIRRFGVVKNFRPTNDADFRVVLEQDGTWRKFPDTYKLTNDDKAGIAALMNTFEG